MAKKAIIEFLYDELPSESHVELQKHIDECQECSRYKTEIQNTLKYLDKNREYQIPTDIAALHECINERKNRFRIFLRRGLPAWTAVGICGVMLLVFALFVTEIRSEGNVLTVTFRGRYTETIAEKTERILVEYRADQLRSQKQLSEELRAAVVSLSQLIDEYEIQRNRQITKAFQQMQIEQHRVLVSIQRQLDTLASQTEDELLRLDERSNLAMAVMAEIVESQ
jgi:hypothetical protein